MVPVTVSAPRTVRAYGLASSQRAGVYLHHYDSHDVPARGIRVELDVPQGDDRLLVCARNSGHHPALDHRRAGRQTFTAPDFIVDIALLLTPDGPPDSDHDGFANDVDPDNDNDGVPNALDAFPLDPEEWQDRDHDMIGDNIDADKDGDGIGDDDNHNGIPDSEELDIDGDGVPKGGQRALGRVPVRSEGVARHGRRRHRRQRRHRQGRRRLQ